MNKRKFMKTLAFAIVIIAVITMSAIVVVFILNQPSPDIKADVIFTVNSDDSGIAIANKLYNNSLIKSKYLFIAMLKIRQLETSLKTGDYLITKSMSTDDILTAIAEGNQLLLKITIPEGASDIAIAKIAQDADIAMADKVLASINNAEIAKKHGLASISCSGYLFPDTYFLPRNSNSDNLVNMMIETFKNKVFSAIPEAKELAPEDLHNRIILSSIIEREYRVPDEAPIMASVFFNRLRIGMALQSCATVVYVITEKLGKPHPQRLFDRDTKITDPFNTYINVGLPPKPICNPGMTAIKAAIRPAVSKYLYFRLIDEASGKHYFSETLDEHIKAAGFSIKPKGK